MEMNEKRQKAINEMNWRRLKKEFDKIETYPEKLEWWEKNVKPPSKIFNPLRNYLFYSTDGSPLIENPYPVSVYSNIPVIHIDKIHDFITIIPDLNNVTNKELFWNWLLKINEIENLSKLETDYLEKFEKSDKMNHSLMIDGFKKEIKNEFENGKLASDEFIDGRNFAIYNDYSMLFKNYPNWNITVIGEDIIIQELDYTLKGYLNRLKEIALDKVINSLNENIIITKNRKKATRQQSVLMFEYIFKEIKPIDNNTKKGEFVEFLNGYNAENLRQIFSNKNSEYIKDLKIIRDYFEDLELHNIVQKINDEISNNYSKKNNNKNNKEL